MKNSFEMPGSAKKNQEMREGGDEFLGEEFERQIKELEGSGQSLEGSIEEKGPWYKENYQWQETVFPKTVEALQENGAVGEQIQAPYYINQGLAMHESNRLEESRNSGEAYDVFNDVPHQLEGIADYVATLADQDGAYLVETGDGYTEKQSAKNAAEWIRKSGVYVSGYNDLPIAAAVLKATEGMRTSVKDKLESATSKEELHAVLDEYEAAGLENAAIDDAYLDGHMVTRESNSSVVHELDRLRQSIEDGQLIGIDDSRCKLFSDAMRRVSAAGGFNNQI